MLCARIPLGHNSLQADQDDKQFYPVKIKAIQGHSAASLEKAGGLFAAAAEVMWAPSVPPERQAAFAGVPICPMSELPSVAYHRTQSHWKSIAKSGLIPGGGDSENSRKAHIYLSDKRYGEEG